jgi:hypothetical protein
MMEIKFNIEKDFYKELEKNIKKTKNESFNLTTLELIKYAFIKVISNYHPSKNMEKYVEIRDTFENYVQKYKGLKLND